MRVILGIFILGVSLIIESFSQMQDFAQGGYLDDELRGRVIESIWKFTLGFCIVGGLIYLIVKYSHKVQ